MFIFLTFRYELKEARREAAIKSCKVNKVKAKRTPLVNYREMNTCLDEEDYEYSDYKDECCDYEYQEKNKFPLEDEKYSTAISSTDANRSALRIYLFSIE